MPSQLTRQQICLLRPNPALPFLLPQHMVAGALAGIGEHVAMYPVDTVKTRMQALAHPGQQARAWMRGWVSVGTNLADCLRATQAHMLSSF